MQPNTRKILEAYEGCDVSVVIQAEVLRGVLWRHGDNFIARVETGDKTETVHIMPWIVDGFAMINELLCITLANDPDSLHSLEGKQRWEQDMHERMANGPLPVEPDRCPPPPPPPPPYFGYGCAYLCGQWGDENDPDHRSYAPNAVFCNHDDNESPFEGNCNKSQCPLKQEA